MDTVLLAETATLLRPFLTNAGTVALRSAGEKLYTLLKRHFDDHSDESGQKVLESVRQEPDVYLEALNRFLEMRIESDEQFRLWLTQQVTSLKPDSVQAGDRSVNITGDNNVVASKGGIAVGGDVQGPIIQGPTKDVHYHASEPDAPSD